MKLEKWKRPDNYIGETYYEYFVGCSKTRDSDNIEKTNFDACLSMLGGESDTVIVVRANHWLVGWVETVMVHEKDNDKLKILLDTAESLESYGILDDEAYSQAEYDDACERYDDDLDHLLAELNCIFVGENIVKEDERGKKDEAKLMEREKFNEAMFNLVLDGYNIWSDTDLFISRWNDEAIIKSKFFRKDNDKQLLLFAA
jgi:hypothetical protein